MWYFFSCSMFWFLIISFLFFVNTSIWNFDLFNGKCLLFYFDKISFILYGLKSNYFVYISRAIDSTKIPIKNIPIIEYMITKWGYSNTECTKVVKLWSIKKVTIKHILNKLVIWFIHIFDFMYKQYFLFNTYIEILIANNYNPSNVDNFIL